ncbi:MAG: hypothetical protein H5T41_01555 [Methanomassiliicoccales archaeon]|jgi:hypothetical protein|nr:hypothetical protein [Methanomassiliicoccales archaeon]
MLAIVMNEKDLSLARSFVMEIDDPRKYTPILIDAKFTQLMRINLILIKALADIMKMRGFIISVDRPYQYIVYLLKMHKINTDGLTFIDVIGNFSADRKVLTAGINLIGEPFRIDALPDIITNSSGIGRSGAVDLKSYGFALIDNIATLINYNGYPVVENFLRNFVHLTSIMNNIFFPIVLDSEKYPLLYETAKSLCKRELKIENYQLSVKTQVGTCGKNDELIEHETELGGL